MSPLLIGISGYVLFQLAIVFFVARRVRSESDYLLAGRRFGTGLATFTIFATWFGAETCIGAAGQVYGGGLSDSTADPFGYAACLLLLGIVFAAPLWRRKLTTLADLFRNRYSPGVEKFAVLLLVPTSLMWAAAQIRALGQVISASSTFDVELAIGIAAGFVIVYTVYGGLMANAITDLVQGITVMIGLVVLLFAVITAAGGIESSVAAIDPERLRLFGGPETPWWEVAERWAIPIFGSVIAQELISVILASHTPQVARRGALLGGSLYLLFGLIPVFIGLVGVSLLPGLEEPEQLLPLIAQKYLATLPYILFVGAMTSAILSTVAGALLAAAALLSHNLIVPLRPAMDNRAKVRVARASVVAGGLLAYLLARHAGGVYELVEQASAFGSSGVFTVVVFGLFTRRGHVRAAYAALTAGVMTWVVSHYVLDLPIAYLLSLGMAMLAYLSVSFTEHPAPQHALE